MNAVEIEQAISDLAEQSFDRVTFPYALLEAFGNKETTIRRLRAGASDAPLREKKFRVLREVRPRTPDEDAAAPAHDEAIEKIGEEAARVMCKAAGPELEEAARGR